MNKAAFIFTLLVLVVSNPLFAQSGQESSTTDSGLMYLLWLVPVIVAAVVVVFKEITEPKR